MLDYGLSKDKPVNSLDEFLSIVSDENAEGYDNKLHVKLQFLLGMKKTMEIGNIVQKQNKRNNSNTNALNIEPKNLPMMMSETNAENNKLILERLQKMEAEARNEVMKEEQQQEPVLDDTGANNMINSGVVSNQERINGDIVEETDELFDQQSLDEERRVKMQTKQFAQNTPPPAPEAHVPEPEPEPEPVPPEPEPVPEPEPAPEPRTCPCP